MNVHEAVTERASPFARSLVFAYVAAYLYDEDTPLAERRAQALTLDRELLAELVGQEALRDLIEPAVLDNLESTLQCLASGYQARDADELHDLLLTRVLLRPAAEWERKHNAGFRASIGLSNWDLFRL